MTESVEPTTAPGRTLAVDERMASSNARMGAFTDAVVAIAMTLLILPLLEAVREFLREHGEDPPVWRYLEENSGQLIAFVISFVVIAMFWTMHHRIFRAETPASQAATLVNIAWMLPIVFLPVATSLTDALTPQPLQVVIYIGTMALSAWLLLVLAALERRDRRRAGLSVPNRATLAAPLAMAVLFMIAMLVAVLTPPVNYFALFLLMLTGPLRSLLIRLGLREDVPGEESTASAGSTT